MLIRTLQFITILLSALSMSMATAHLLEMPPRLEWHARLWIETTVTGDLFRLYGSIGAIVETLSWIAALGLAFALRRDSNSFKFAGAGAALLLVAYILWWLFVFPANQQHSTWTPDAYPADWASWRAQWEYAHVARAILIILGFCSLLLTPILRQQGS